MTERDDEKNQVSDEQDPARSAEPALWEALVAAYRPTAVDPKRHESLLAEALEDPLREASDDERAESERFRDALEGRASHEDLALVQALALSHPSAGRADQTRLEVNEAAIAGALAKLPAAPPETRTRATKSNVVYVAFGVVTAAALAAAAVMLVTFPVSKTEQQLADVAATPAVAKKPELAQSRSTTSLFKSKFERTSTTARMDTIASVRMRELRDNRYAEWGIR